jgi:acetyl esterase
LIEQAEALKLDTKKIIVAGDSVGGNMATALTLMAKKQQSPKIDLQLLFYPVTDANFETGSYHQFADGPWLTREAMKWFWNAYAPEEEQRHDILASPLRATWEQLQDLPPACIITAENDVLRDEGEAYACKLLAAGVRTLAVRYQGTIHDFVMLNDLAATTPARAAMAQACAIIRDVLSKH